ncbi:class I SAM-dependent methyltransferase [Rhodococcus chondri]|uniref:SAM-dependent methyltransferase n=1 Tax=Rhodococcus chondri TaxID=3065941 RepID=A0ABU7JNF9_9NOCA|nr:SAM-dependent methyltransferase [Rhodococcus sp. CC-R104]MEE2031578.1 SAM-dependent methyltransferase [Rhodococcus sp. CC-R104]
MTDTIPARLAFVIAAMNPQPGSFALEIGSGIAADLVAARVGPVGTVRVAETPHSVTGAFDLVYCIDVPLFRDDGTAAPAAVASLLRPGGQLWVFDEPPSGISTGPLSMNISAALARSGFVIVDMIEEGRTIGLCATVSG